MDQPISVAIFAYNEEAFIAANLRSVMAECASFPCWSVVVLANGCSDRTVAIARAVAADEPRVKTIELPLADKCNAWNTYVHEHVNDGAFHVFMDGDVRSAPGSFARMLATLSACDHATAVAGLPLSGRNREVYSRYVRDRGWIFGNLYALRQSHLAKLVARNIRLPLGLRGNDHMITRFAHSDLGPPWHEDPTRVVYDESAGYCFDSLQPFRARDVRIYFRRKITYRLRELQLKRIWDIPLDQLPEDMDDINRDILRQLRSTRVGLFDNSTRQVIKRLERMYPHEGASFYRTASRASRDGEPATTH